MASKKKMMKAKLKYSLGDLYMIESELHEVRFINGGKAWLGPIVEDVQNARFPHCLDRVLDAYGYTKLGIRCYLAPNLTRSFAV